MHFKAVSKTFVLAAICVRVFARTGDVAATITEGSRENSQTTYDTHSVNEVLNNTNQKPAFTARTRITYNPQNINHQLIFIDGPDKTIVFEEVITNAGSHYNSATGIFVAPVAGQYYFSINVKDFSGIHSTTLHIVLNGNRVAEVATLNKEYFGADSNSVVIELLAGDEVYVRSYNPGGRISGSFTGFQI